MRFLLAFLLLAHGIAHVPGFLVSWQLAAFPDLTYRTTIFGASVNVGPEGIRLIGLCWLGLAGMFVVLASAIAFNAPFRLSVTAGALAMSIVLCAAGWPEARLGLVANAVIALLFVWMRSGVVSRALP